MTDANPMQLGFKIAYLIHHRYNTYRPILLEINSGYPLAKIQQAMDGRWMYNIANQQWVQDNKTLLIRFSARMLTVLESNNYHKYEWKNVYT